MANPITFDQLDFNLVADIKEGQTTPAAETPFRILCLGDFSGRENRLSDFRTVRVDRDNFDQVLGKIKPELRLSVLGKNEPDIAVNFTEPDDFHPDNLYNNLEIFKALKDTADSLDDPAVLAALCPTRQPEKKDEEQKTSPVATVESSGSLLDQIIEQTPDSPAAAATAPESGWDSFLRTIVSPHIAPDADPRKQEIKDGIAAAGGELLRMILHHPDFQALEAAWRGLYFLVSRLETDSSLELHIADISQAGLSADLCGADDLRKTTLYQLLVADTVDTPGGEPWAVVAGNYNFGNSRTDIETLARMAMIAQAAGAPFVAGADEKLVCAESPAATPAPDGRQPAGKPLNREAWLALRQLPEAAYLGLGLPRFLLRLPYGDKTDPIGSFEFNEMTTENRHQDYLWGNFPFAAALLLGRTFSRQGWKFSQGIIQEIDNLPLHIYKENGESRVKPCAEIMLNREAAEQILEQGLMPLLSFMNQDKIRLGRWQSIAEPLKALAGPWE